MQEERYPDVRQIAPATPRILRRLIHAVACARSLPAGSPRSRAVRRTLERALGRPSPLDCRSEIAQHLWALGAFRAADGRYRPPEGAAATSQDRDAATPPLGAVGRRGPARRDRGLAGYGALPAGARPSVSSCARPERRAEPPLAAAPLAAPPVAVIPALPRLLEPRTCALSRTRGPRSPSTARSSFFTPRAAPVELQPGAITSSSQHPTLRTRRDDAGRRSRANHERCTTSSR